MKVKITDYLNKKKGSVCAWMNVSIPERRQQKVADGLAFFLHRPPPKSKSSVFCDGVIIHAWVVRNNLLSDEQIRSILEG